MASPQPSMDITTTSAPSVDYSNASINHSASSRVGTWVCAVIESRGTGREIGMATWEWGTGNIILTQFADSQTYVKCVFALNQRTPSLILIPATLVSGESLGKINDSSERHFSGSDGMQSNESQKYTADDQHDSGTPTILVQCLREVFENVEVIGVARRLWNAEDGQQFIQKYALQNENKSAVLSALNSKFYALSAACCLFQYLESNHKITFADESVNIRFVALEGTMFIDYDTATHLELTRSAASLSKSNSLLGILNHCHTRGGARLLRTDILCPHTDVSTIKGRFDAVSTTIEWLVASENAFSQANNALSKLKGRDIDYLIGAIIAVNRERRGGKSSSTAREAERKIGLLVQVQILINSIPDIKAAVTGSNASLLQTIDDLLSDPKLQEIDTFIKDTIADEVFHTLKKGTNITRSTKIYAVKSNRKLLLEVARTVYRENVADIQTYVESLAEEYGLPVDVHVTRDVYEIVMPDSGINLPDTFINVRRKGGKIRCQTLSLVSDEISKKEAKREGSSEFTGDFSSQVSDNVDIYQNSATLNVFSFWGFSDEILEGTINDIQRHVPLLYRCSEAISLLDMLYSLSKAAIFNNYVKPEFSDVMAVKSGRHPILEKSRTAVNDFVPNDTYFSETSSFQIITGPNMSGKSTYLSQCALLIIMAQIGSFVPADYASFKIHSALLSRLSNDDCIEGNLSTFTREMSQMAMIIGAQQQFPNPFIIIDELGRGTAPNEGIGIAHALAEELIKSKAFCLFSTHFTLLDQTLSAYPNVVSLTMAMETNFENQQGMTPEHRLTDGTSKATHYGLQIASHTGLLPKDALVTARSVSEKLEGWIDNSKLASRGTKVSNLRKDVSKAVQSLSQASKSTRASEEDLRMILKGWQERVLGGLKGIYLQNRDSEEISERVR